MCEHPASGIEHPASSIRHRASGIEHEILKFTAQTGPI
jgi:hypothetical protein